MKNDIRAKKILKKNKGEGLTLLGFKSYKALVSKAVWYWLQDSQIDQQQRMQVQKQTDATQSFHLWQSYSTGVSEDDGLSSKWSWINWVAIGEKMNLDLTSAHTQNQFHMNSISKCESKTKLLKDRRVSSWAWVGQDA